MRPAGYCDDPLLTIFAAGQGGPMSRARLPSFQFYPQDFISSRAVNLMTPEQRGGYIMLLCHAWMSEQPGVLPADDPTLAALSGLSDRWVVCRDAILRAFERGSEDGPPIIFQQRMIEERKNQRRRYAQAKEAGRLSGVARRAKIVNGIGTDVERALNEKPTPSSSSSSSGSKKNLIPRGSLTLQITDIDIAKAMERHSLDRETVEHLAEVICLEGPQRGYKNYPAALLKWCRRESLSAKNGVASDPYGPALTLKDIV